MSIESGFFKDNREVFSDRLPEGTAGFTVSNYPVCLAFAERFLLGSGAE